MALYDHKKGKCIISDSENVCLLFIWGQRVSLFIAAEVVLCRYAARKLMVYKKQLLLSKLFFYVYLSMINRKMIMEKMLQV